MKFMETLKKRPKSVATFWQKTWPKIGTIFGEKSHLFQPAFGKTGGGMQIMVVYAC
jgi:hypothetical protein